MLKYMENSTDDNVTNQNIASIQELVNKVKRKKEVGISYMKSWEMEELARKQGYNDGFDSGLNDGFNDGFNEFARHDRCILCFVDLFNTGRLCEILRLCHRLLDFCDRITTSATETKTADPA